MQGRIIAFAVLGGLFAVRAADYFEPSHRLPAISSGRAEITPAVLEMRTERMIQSQTFVIMRNPEAVAGAERVTSPRLNRIFEKAAASSGLPLSTISAMAYLESWGDSQAVSPAGPKGIMQFSEATARAAGLRVVRVTKFKTVTERKLVRNKAGKPVYRRVSHKVPSSTTVRDDRLNPERAVPAAAQYLARLETKYGERDWAIFAYHCGEGCVAELRPLAEAAVLHKEPVTVAEMFFAASPAQHPALYEALQRHMQRDYSPTYWFRVQRAEQLLGLFRRDRGAFGELADEYRNPTNAARRASDRLKIWLKQEDNFYRTLADLQLADGKELARAFEDPEIFGFTLPTLASPQELYREATPAAIGTLLYVAFETHRLFDALHPLGERFVPLAVTELVTTTDRPAEAGAVSVDPEFPEHATGQVFDIDRSNLPRGERECLNFTLEDMGWDGDLGFIEVTGDTLHVGSSPSAREFFASVFQDALEARPKEHLESSSH